MTGPQKQCGELLTRVDLAKQHVAESEGPVRWYWLTWLGKYRDQLAAALRQAGVSVVEDLPADVQTELGIVRS